MSDESISVLRKPPSRSGLKSQSRAERLGIPKPLRAMRMKCLDCTCHQPAEVKACRIRNCALWPYRMGRFPKPEELASKGVFHGE